MLINALSVALSYPCGNGTPTSVARVLLLRVSETHWVLRRGPQRGQAEAERSIPQPSISLCEC